MQLTAMKNDERGKFSSHQALIAKNISTSAHGFYDLR
jgi:hypothetical protein